VISFFTLSDGTEIERHDCPICQGFGLGDFGDPEGFCYRCGGEGVVEYYSDDHEQDYVEATFRPRSEVTRG
jgi:hypothetical protein